MRGVTMSISWIGQDEVVVLKYYARGVSTNPSRGLVCWALVLSLGDGEMAESVQSCYRQWCEL